jgi:uncharacterized protein YajQ (UPF0234 family)
MHLPFSSPPDAKKKPHKSGTAQAKPSSGDSSNLETRRARTQETTPTTNTAKPAADTTHRKQSRSRSRPPRSSSSPNQAPPQPNGPNSIYSSYLKISTPPDVSKLIDLKAQDLVNKLFDTVMEWNLKGARDGKRKEEIRPEKKTEHETENSKISFEWHEGRKEFKLMGSNKLKLDAVEEIAQGAFGKTNQEKWIFNVRRNAVGGTYRLAIHLSASQGTAPITDKDMRDALAKAFVKQLKELAADERFRYLKDCDGGKYMFDKYCNEAKEKGFSIDSLAPAVRAVERKRDVSYALDNLIIIDHLFIDCMLAIVLSFYLAYRNVMGNMAFNHFWHDKDLGRFALKYPSRSFPYLETWPFKTLKDIEIGQMVYIKGPPSAFTFKPTSTNNGHNVLCSKAGKNPLFTGFDSFKEQTMTEAYFKQLMESKYQEPYTYCDIFELHYRSQKYPEDKPRVSGVTYGVAWAELEEENGSKNVENAVKEAKAVEKKSRRSNCDKFYKSCDPIIKMPMKRLTEKSEGCETVTAWF